MLKNILKQSVYFLCRIIIIVINIIIITYYK